MTEGSFGGPFSGGTRGAQFSRIQGRCLNPCTSSPDGRSPQSPSTFQGFFSCVPHLEDQGREHPFLRHPPGEKGWFPEAAVGVAGGAWSCRAGVLVLSLQPAWHLRPWDTGSPGEGHVFHTLQSKALPHISQAFCSVRRWSEHF